MLEVPQVPEFPTRRGRRTQAATDTAARTVIARAGILATTIADIAADAGRLAASLTTTTTPKRRSSRPDEPARIQALATVNCRTIYRQEDR
ncbi:hypothetical protein MSHI_32050 [Mycobacterium shinjukuense]|uniref:TetR family transcriptional regulator n=1 Tax=Mycobacterium shinjukuense TaxID=398694 RepID=A0A7I7MVR7_9MYCO|nr:hypothetical protein MSHI_32050 [Mycobacterium shinjukuense]